MYTNLNNPVNYQLQDFGQFGFRVLDSTSMVVDGETYRTLYVVDDAVVSATTSKGDDLVSKPLLAGTLLHGLFSAPTLASGKVLAYMAGRLTAEEILELYRAYLTALGVGIENTDCLYDDLNEMGADTYADASLVLIPSGYSTGKIYGQRPLSADSQIDFTRASTATRVNASGLIEEVASGVPRLDYTNSSCPKLLLEPQRTNTLTYSEAFDNADWSKLNLSVSANTSDTLDPAGYYGADKVTDNATNAAHLAFRLSQWDTTQRTASVFAKAGTSSKVYIQNASTGQGVFADLSAETIVVSSNFTGTLTAYGNGWYRITATHTAAAAQTIAIGLFTGTSTASYSGTGSYAYIWGAQLEAGAYATSYIPTLGTSVTRVADAASKTGITNLIGQTEGTIFVEFVHDISVTAPSDSRIQLSDGTNGQWIFMGFPDGATKLLRMYIASVSGNLSFYSNTGVVQGLNKAAFAYKSGDFAAYLNGAQVATNTTAHAIPPCSRITLQGNDPTSVTRERENIKQALLFKKRLSNDELAALTTL